MSSKISVGSKSPSKTSQNEDKMDERAKEEAWYTQPDFIYGGPFISVTLPSPFLDMATPINIQLSGSFKKSFAYYSLKERLPIILTKIIDYLSRESNAIKSANNASEEDLRSFISYVAKLKNDLVTNKNYDHFTVDTPDAKKWNQWIDDLDQKKYFFNTWVFSECYVYRRLREGCQLTKGLNNFDYFEDQKNKSFKESEELMCLVANKVVNMLEKSEKDKRKVDFVMLLKLCLWANKCDLSLSLGEQVSMADGEKTQAPCIARDPFQMIIDLKDKLLVDHTSKIADQIVAKADKKRTAIENDKPPPEPAPEAKPEGKKEVKPEVKPEVIPEVKQEVKEEGNEEGTEEKIEEPKPVRCPSKLTVPRAVYIDIVCDNAGYELFADLCLGHFLIAQEIIQKVRFHVKNMPWFVSDVTPKDFQFVINSCAKSGFSKAAPEPVEVKTEKNENEVKVEKTEINEKEVKIEQPEKEESTEPKPEGINSDNLKKLGEQWNQYVQDGTFEVLAEDYWTYPHVYKDMKKYDPNLYRKFQNAVAVVFKGDLNYRKLLGERNCNPYQGFEPSLQGFIPAPIVAIRTVKADLICGLPKGKFDQLKKIDEKWMEKGDYGVIQYCPKGEALKPTDKPCEDYGVTCFGVTCPAPK